MMNESNRNNEEQMENQMDEQLLDQMISQATEGLEPEQEQELRRLLEESGMSNELEKIEATTATFDLAAAELDDAAIPEAVRDKLLIQAGQFFSNVDAELGSVEPSQPSQLGQPSQHDDAALSASNAKAKIEYGKIVQPSTLSSSPNPSSQVSSPRTSSGDVSRGSIREIVAWMTAAACLVFGLWAWNAKPVDGSVDRVAATSRVDAATDVQTVDWLGVHSTQVTGRIVWSHGQQGGYMVFENMPINDPDKEQYQLWIFDGDVNQEIPVDGGVFDIVDSKATVLFSARHRVDKAVQFAVTIEQPDGVQRSKREKIPVLATLPGAEETGPPSDLPPGEGDTVNWRKIEEDPNELVALRVG